MKNARLKYCEVSLILLYVHSEPSGAAHSGRLNYDAFFTSLFLREFETLASVSIHDNTLLLLHAINIHH
jgi:hypothetical protein